jgi:hypothetical protein
LIQVGRFLENPPRGWSLRFSIGVEAAREGVGEIGRRALLGKGKAVGFRVTFFEGAGN